MNRDIAVKEYKLFFVPVFKIKDFLKLQKIYLFGVPVAEICNSSDYKRKKIKICGISITRKTKDWLKKANEENLRLNEVNLGYQVPAGGKSILYVASNYVDFGGIETRIFQYANQLQALGWNVYILSENNVNKKLNEFVNFNLIFDGDNLDKCLNEIIDRYKIDVVEFQFKHPKILKNLDIARLKTKARVGCVIHNLGIKDINSINKFDYKIMVSRYMYENYYIGIKDAVVIQNCINPDTNLPVWQYKNQETALMISRINMDKIKSIECFIKYCRKNGYDFKIAGEEPDGYNLKNELITKYNLSEEHFIGPVKTVEYLSEHMNEILFVGGVGLVILEAAYLNYPCLVCSDYRSENYSFVTNSNAELFDNFTIRKESLVSQQKKKESYLDLSRIEEYELRNYISQNRNLKTNVGKYIEVIRGGYAG